MSTTSRSASFFARRLLFPLVALALALGCDSTRSEGDEAPAKTDVGQDATAPTADAQGDRDTLERDGAPLESDAAPLEPDAALLDPDAALLDPDAALLDPDAALLDPDAALLDPDAAPLDPDAAPLDPDAAPSPADAALIDLDAALVDLDAAPPPPLDAAPPPPNPDPLSPRVENLTCRFPALPPLGAMRVVEAFPALDFQSPLWLGHAGDGQDRLYVAERGGGIFTFENRDNVGPNDRVRFHTVPTQAGGEMGLLGLAFHPNYAENGLLYTYASVSPPHRSRIAEWRRDPDNALRVLPESERVLLEVPQPFENHNGGDLQFGPDGFLYIALGDGGSGGDPQNNGQRPTQLLGSIVRIDVDRVDAARGLAYGIPEDNPFAACTPNCGALGAARPEIFAFGLRNPWRTSFDPSTGLLWAGDVGQDRWEEIDIIRRGGNYGWRVMEGNHCHRPAAGCNQAPYAAPIHEYGRDVGRSITGGRVYRGPTLPTLWGAYVFGDYGSGRIWALRPNADHTATTEVALLVDSDLQLTSFGVDARQNLYLVAFNRNSSLHRLEPAVGAPPAADFPQRLSETGCFADLAALTPAEGVVPYGVQSPLWSDGAGKLRHFALPPGGVFEYRENDAWEAPEGTVFLKTFTLPRADGGERRLETRVYVRQATGWQGFTYRWNEAQDDADLLEDGQVEALDPAVHPQGPDAWTYPSRAQCDTCHTPASNHVLGFQTAQLNGDFAYASGATQQLEALQLAGYVALPGPVDTLPRYAARDDDAAPVEDRARAMLASNCAHCHRPDGQGNTRIDLRANIPLSEAGLCDVSPGQGDLGLEDARLLAPGDPARSVLHARITRRGPSAMPPLATRAVDDVGVSLVTRWIEGLGACPE
jgi:uncharacterized repeat protein (TIGR03806 family)